MLLKTGEDYEPDKQFIRVMQDCYPRLDIQTELRKMAGWCYSNPGKRKTKRGIKRFINNWLARAYDNLPKSETVKKKPCKIVNQLDRLNRGYNILCDKGERAFALFCREYNVDNHDIECIRTRAHFSLKTAN